MPETKPGISFNEKRMCNYCRKTGTPSVSSNKEVLSRFVRKDEFRKEFERYVKNIRGKQQYDCLLLFSGGKDSAYLLKVLIERYGLKVLPLTVDNGLLSDAAKENIQDIVKKRGLEHIFLKPGKNFFKKIYKYYLINPQGKPYCDIVCSICSHSIHSIGLRYAAEEKIPFVALAYSPEQTDHYFYEITDKEINKNWIPKELKDKNSFKNIKYFWDPKEFDFHPRFLLPFHVIDYPSVEEITKELSESDLLPKNKTSSLATNCDLLWVLVKFDQKKYKYNDYLEDLSDNIRQGRMKRKNNYLLFTVGLWLLEKGFIKRKQCNKALNYIGLKTEEIYSALNL